MPERWDPAYRDTRFRRLVRAGRRTIVTAGDSWFDYPMYENIVDLLDDEERYAFHRFDANGDTAQNKMLHMQPFVEALRADDAVCLLLSVGGNDFVQAEWLTSLFRPFDPARADDDYLDPVVWDARLGEVMTAYRTILDAVGGTVPVFAHGYDYIVPSRTGVRWNNLVVVPAQVIVALEARGIVDPALQVRLAAILIDRFAAGLDQLQQERPGAFVHVDLRGTLAGTDWQNEIHPTAAGFQLLARRFGDAVEAQLRGGTA